MWKLQCAFLFFPSDGTAVTNENCWSFLFFWNNLNIAQCCSTREIGGKVFLNKFLLHHSGFTKITSIEVFWWWGRWCWWWCWWSYCRLDEQAYVDKKSRQAHLFTRVGAFPAKRSSLDLLQIWTVHCPNWKSCIMNIRYESIVMGNLLVLTIWGHWIHIETLSLCFLLN